MWLLARDCAWRNPLSGLCRRRRTGRGTDFAVPGDRAVSDADPLRPASTRRAAVDRWASDLQAVSAAQRPFLRIAHRGAAALEPENTLRAIEAALRIGVEMVEIDVRPCADGTLMVVHDDDLSRVAGVTDRVSASTPAHLKTIDVGKGEHIPTLEDVLALLRGRALVNIDQKAEDLAPQLLKVIDRVRRREEIMLSGGATPHLSPDARTGPGSEHFLQPGCRLAQSAAYPGRAVDGGRGTRRGGPDYRPRPGSPGRLAHHRLAAGLASGHRLLSKGRVPRADLDRGRPTDHEATARGRSGMGSPAIDPTC